MGNRDFKPLPGLQWTALKKPSLVLIREGIGSSAPKMAEYKSGWECLHSVGLGKVSK